MLPRSGNTWCVCNILNSGTDLLQNQRHKLPFPSNNYIGPNGQESIRYLDFNAMARIQENHSLPQLRQNYSNYLNYISNKFSNDLNYLNNSKYFNNQNRKWTDQSSKNQSQKVVRKKIDRNKTNNNDEKETEEDKIETRKIQKGWFHHQDQNFVPQRIKKFFNSFFSQRSLWLN